MSLILALAAAASVALADPAEEARAQSLEREIRCVVCQNEPIAQSTAEIAGDMRALVRERIEAGDTDAEIRGFFRERYGDFVLLRPPVDERTWLLWGGPLLLLLAGLGAVWTTGRNARRAGQALAPEESER